MIEKEGIYHTFREKKFLKALPLAKNINWNPKIQIKVDSPGQGLSKLADTETLI